jgi:translocation and assembly module TamB
LKFLATKIGRVLILGALILTLGAVGLSVYLDSAAFRTLALGRINGALDGRIEVAAHRLSLLSGRLVLTGVRLERADAHPLAEIEHLDLQVSWAALLQHTVRISMLALENVRVFLEFDHSDRLLRIGPATGTREPVKTRRNSAPWRVVVDQCRIKGGTVTFVQPSRKLSGMLENLQLAVSLDSGAKRGKLRLSAGPLTWRLENGSRNISDLSFSADYDHGAFSTASLQTGQSRLSAKGRLAWESDVPVLDLTADLDLAMDDVRSWIPGDIRLEGRTAATISARGPVGDPVVNLHLSMPRGNLAGISVAPLKADLNYVRGRISIEALQAADRWGRLEASAVIDPLQGKIEHGNATLTASDLTALGEMFGVELPSGSGHLQISCSGPWSGPAARAKLLVQNLKWRQLDLGRLVAAADLDAAGTLRFSQLALENRGSLVEGRGRLTLRSSDGRWRSDPQLNLSLDMKNLEAEDFGMDPPVKVVVSAGLTAKGTVRHLRGEVTLTNSRLQWKDRVFDLKGSALWEDGRLTVPNLVLSKDDAEMRMQGRMAWRDPVSGAWLNAPRIEAGLRSRNAKLQDFFADYSGGVVLEAQAEGTPSGLKGDFRLAGSNLVLAGQPLSGADVKGRLADRKVVLDAVDVTVAVGHELHGRGWLGFDQRFQMMVQTTGIGLDFIPSLQRAYPVEGRMTLTLEGRGTLKNPLVTARITVHQPRLNHRPWDDFHLNARLENRRLEVDADLNFKLEAHTRLDSGDFELNARLADADLSPYLAMAGGAGWSGNLTARLQAGGNWHRPWAIQAELNIGEALLRYASLDLLRTRNLQARIRGGRLELSPSRLDFMADGFLNLSASGDVRSDLRLNADGRVPLSALAPFSDALGEARGELTFQADASGGLDALQWQTDIHLVDIALEIPGLQQEVRGLNGHARLTTGELELEQVSGRMDNGRFDLSGRLKLSDWMPVAGNLAFKARALPLQWPGTMDVVLNGDLTLAGAQSGSSLTGRVVLLEGTYYKDVRLNLLSAVGQPRRAEPVPATYTLPPWLAEIGLNVSLAHRYPLLVDNNMARLQVAPDLKLSGTLGRPVLNGRARVTEGEVIFRRKTFTVKRGVVDFINPYKIEPTLDIAAEAQVRQWLVALNLSGTPDRLVFHLSSDPPESESDILSLILLGRTSGELTGGQGGGGQTTRQMLATLVATAWGEDVKTTTGVDILEVETGTGDADDSADTIQVTVGKRLSRRLTIKYEVESGSEELIQRAVSEYRFIEHLLASGFQDSLGGYGGELLFRIEF